MIGEDNVLVAKGAGKEDQGGGKEENPTLTMYRGRLRTAAQITEVKEREKEKKKIRIQKNKATMATDVPGYPKPDRHNPYKVDRGLTRSVISKVKSQVKPKGDAPDSHQGSTPKAGPISSHDTGVLRLDPDQSVSIFRKDRGTFSFEDTLHVGALVNKAEISAIRKTGKPVSYSITQARRRDETYMLQCDSPDAIEFYQQALNGAAAGSLPSGHPGYEAFRPQESPIHRRIWGKVYRAYEPDLDTIHWSFASGSRGAVQIDQVRQYRPPFIQPEGMVWVYLELDQAAFDWLIANNNKSRIGTMMVSWVASTLPGIHGNFAPGEDQAAFRRNQIDELIRQEREKSISPADPLADSESPAPVDHSTERVAPTPTSSSDMEIEETISPEQMAEEETTLTQSPTQDPPHSDMNTSQLNLDQMNIGGTNYRSDISINTEDEKELMQVLEAVSESEPEADSPPSATSTPKGKRPGRCTPPLSPFKSPNSSMRHRGNPGKVIRTRHDSDVHSSDNGEES